MFAAIAAAVTLLACANAPRAVPATLDPQGRMLLTGEWSGTYESTARGRSGYITFELEQDADSTICRGDVLMVPEATGEPVRPMAGRDNRTGQPFRAPRLLAIESLRVTGNMLSGRIEPYEDPETFHPVRTSFDGRVRGDTIRGTLVIQDQENGVRFEGTWMVVRKAAK